MNSVKELQNLIQTSYVFRPNIINLPNNVIEPSGLSIDDIKPINEKIRTILVGLTQKTYNAMAPIMKNIIHFELDLYNNSYQYLDKNINSDSYFIKTKDEYNKLLKKISIEFILNIVNQELTESGSKNISNFLKLFSNFVTLTLKYSPEQKNLGLVFIEEFRKTLYNSYDFSNYDDTSIPNIKTSVSTLNSNLSINSEEAELIVDKCRRNIIKSKNLAHLACKLYISGEKSSFYLRKENFVNLLFKVFNKSFETFTELENCEKTCKQLTDNVETNKLLLNDNLAKLQQLEDSGLETEEEEIEYSVLFNEIENIKLFLLESGEKYSKLSSELDIKNQTHDIFCDIVYILVSGSYEYMQLNKVDKLNEITDKIKNNFIKITRNTRILSLTTELLKNFNK